MIPNSIRLNLLDIKKCNMLHPFELESGVYARVAGKAVVKKLKEFLN